MHRSDTEGGDRSITAPSLLQRGLTGDKTWDLGNGNDCKRVTVGDNEHLVSANGDRIQL